MDYIDLYDLQVGDLCMEDCFPEVYKVIGKEFDEVLGADEVILEDVKTNQQKSFGYSVRAYAPCMILLERSNSH